MQSANFTIYSLPVAQVKWLPIFCQYCSLHEEKRKQMKDLHFAHLSLICKHFICMSLYSGARIGRSSTYASGDNYTCAGYVNNGIGNRLSSATTPRHREQIQDSIVHIGTHS